MSTSFDTNPKVSVVMTVYNGLPYLEQAVESIFAQEYDDWEFIIVDDGSDDGSSVYLDQLQFDRLTVLRQPNAGQQAAANLGISIAKGKYIARMDADDIAEPTRLRKQAAFLDQNSDVTLVGSQVLRMSKCGSGMRSRLPCSHDLVYNDLINNRHAMCNAATMFRKDTFEEVGGYWKYNISEDWDFFLRAGEAGKLANMDEALMHVRFHSGSINGRRMFEAQTYNEFACELARRRQLKLPPISVEEFVESNLRFRIPFRWFFQMDCYGVLHYREAICQLYGGQKIRGGLRMLFAMACTPLRTFSRAWRSVRHSFEMNRPEPRTEVTETQEKLEAGFQESLHQR